ncbi:phosphoglycerate mutase-like protein [Amylocystis lapponica]|nr:phosphoglycerate mutase-like protein [Amylocystis lapponica]
MTLSRIFSIVPGFFAQDSPDANVFNLVAIPPRFGLIDDSPDRWTTFKMKIDALNRAAPEGTTYKVLFLGRHGQGYHNVGEAKYGTKAWDDYWSKLNGDGELVWGPDPLLTPLGISQAEDARSVWLAEVTNGIPLPEKCYASPLHRALSTWEFTFSGPGSFATERRSVLILEDLREEHGVHTCDMRNPRSKIERNFPPPTHGFEADFSEEDLIWRADERETKEHIKQRAATVLDRIFDEHQSVYISVTAHGGIINAFLAVMGRVPYPLPTGGILPLVVKGVEVSTPQV